MSRWMLVGLLLLAAQVSWSANMERGPLREPRRALDVAHPQDENYVLNNGTLALNFTNWGFFGNDGANQSGSLDNPCDGEWAPQFEYPIGSGANYLFQGAVWIGAYINDGTNRNFRVSVGTDGWQNPSINEFHAGELPGHGITLRSNLPDATDCFGNSIYDPSAHANIEAVAVYTDTLTDQIFVRNDPTDGPHVPIGIEITQTARLWSSPDFARFVILEFQIENISPDTIFDPVLGLYLDGDIGVAGNINDHIDDITGALLVHDGTDRTLGWIADNDGRTVQSGDFRLPHALGFAGLSISADSLSTNQPGSYNWWNPNADLSLDFGPSWTDSPDWMSTWGTPEGDLHKYDLLASGEHDYGQYALRAAHPAQNDDYPCHPGTDHTWRAVDIDDATQRDIADGYDCRFMLSWNQFGHYDHVDEDGMCHFRLAPGESGSFTSTLFIGEYFHDPDNPQPDPTNLDSTLFNYAGLLESYESARTLYDAGYAYQPPTPAVDLLLTHAANQELPLAWLQPEVGGVAGYRVYGIADGGQGERTEFTEVQISETEYTIADLTNGDDWLIEVETYDVDGHRSFPARKLARVGAVPNDGLLEGAAIDGGDSLHWESVDDPMFSHYKLVRTSANDTVVFDNLTTTFLVDQAVFSGVEYTYWLVIVGTNVVESLPGNEITLIPYAPTLSILVYDETKTPLAAEYTRMAVSDTLVRNFYQHLLGQINEPFDYYDPPNEADVLPLDSLARYQVVIWHNENPYTLRTLHQSAIESVLSRYVAIGGKLIRFGRNTVYGSTSSIGVLRSQLTLSQFAPLEFDSVWAAMRYLPTNPLSDIRTVGATATDEDFPALAWDMAKLSELRYLNITNFDFLPGVDFFWRRGNTWTLYDVILSESDTSGFDHSPCAVIGPGEIFFGFPLLCGGAASTGAARGVVECTQNTSARRSQASG